MARLAPRLLVLLLVAAAPLAAQVDVSENPVRSDRVVISWPTGLGTVSVSVYTFTGEQLLRAPVAASNNDYVWDLTVGGGTRRVVNGVYLIVVTAGGRHFRRRLFVARPVNSP